ncbi:MAG: MerR family transcriptional regulator, partial [Planctomycetes bacterium]|nr:MerR family transcriptional regulator [Planctomycetota bacterium]
MEKYFKIGDIAKLYGIGTDSVRYYEELQIITPRRDVNGYRLYSVNDIWCMNVIRDLRTLGFSMERIKSYLENRSVDSTIQMLEEELSSINERLAYFRNLKTNVMERLKIMHAAKKMRMGVVSRQHIKERRCYEIREGYATDEEMDVIIQKLLNIDPSHHFIIGNNRIGSRLTIESVRRGKFRDYNAVFIISDNGDVPIPGGDYLTVSYRGSCEQNSLYLPMLLEYAESHGLRLAGDVLELLLMDIHEASDMDDHISELQITILPGSPV